MIFVPTRRWYWGAVGLAGVGILGMWWPSALGLMLVLDGVWLLALVVDGFLTPSVATLTVDREATPAFSMGRSMPVYYHWRHPHRRTLTVLVREHFPIPLGGNYMPDREVAIPPGQTLHEAIDVEPRRRGKDTAGRLDLRVRGPIGLIWRQGYLERPWTGGHYSSTCPST